MDYLEGLNTKQREAVLHTEGPLLILAGAGTGKTSVITHRILHLIKSGVAPEHILAVTFTNKAASEMQGRIYEMLRKYSPPYIPTRKNVLPYISTFHALGVRILRDNARAALVHARFSIFDRGDSLRAIKEAMKSADVDIKQFEPRKILSAISRQKGEGVNFSDYELGMQDDYYRRTVGRVWEVYEAILRKERALDFDDLLLKTAELLKQHEKLRSHYEKRFHYLHIDEYQDTNRVQYDIARLLAGTRANICVVGDIDQTIYSWRGADLENLLTFEATYPKTHVVLLEQNYRSTKTILDASNTIIEKNVHRKPKRLFTKNRAGEKITLAGLSDETEESLFIATSAKAYIASGVPPREIAVLYRANFQSRALEEAFLSLDVPYQVLGVRFFERKEVKDILSFLRAARNEKSHTDLARIINVPPRGIGKITLFKMLLGKEDTLSRASHEKVSAFRTLLARIEKAARTKVPSETIKFIVRETGLEKILKGGSADDLERLENIHELATLATRYDALPSEEGIERLLEDAALATDQDELRDEKNVVRLMTVHAAKGLEFDYVFVTGLEEGLFPHHTFSDERVDDEEERRLFYVALTRARKKVVLSFAHARTIFGSREMSLPSEFITDIDPSLIEEASLDTLEPIISA